MPQEPIPAVLLPGLPQPCDQPDQEEDQQCRGGNAGEYQKRQQQGLPDHNASTVPVQEDGHMPVGGIVGPGACLVGIVLLCLVHCDGFRNGFLHLRLYGGCVPGTGLPLFTPVQQLYIGMPHIPSGEAVVDPGYAAVCLFCIGQVIAERRFRL